MAKLLSVEYLKLSGGVLILWIAVKLLTEDHSDSGSYRAGNLWKAFWMIIVADISMGTDNMLVKCSIFFILGCLAFAKRRCQ